MYNLCVFDAEEIEEYIYILYHFVYIQKSQNEILNKMCERFRQSLTALIAYTGFYSRLRLYCLSLLIALFLSIIYRG